MTEYESLYTTAHLAGMEALALARPRPMVVSKHKDMMDDTSPVEQEWYVEGGVCGFAWVNIKPGTSKLARAWKAAGYARKDSYYGGVMVWVREGGQSYERKMVYARAFAAVLRKAGYKAYSAGRLE